MSKSKYAPQYEPGPEVAIHFGMNPLVTSTGKISDRKYLTSLLLSREKAKCSVMNFTSIIFPSFLCNGQWPIALGPEGSAIVQIMNHK